MTNRSRNLMIFASLLLIGAYFVPLWNISLDAPQYPEGIGLRIWINNIDGQNPHDLDKINNLNHYIGMKKIEPDSILELKYMPFIIGFMIVFGLLTAFLGKRNLIFAWVGVFLIICLAGLYDFYLWGYDYGHNLDTETAIIKVPGMTYQPPVIGSKQLLNFTALSLPGIGGYLVAVSILSAIVATMPWRSRKGSPAVGKGAANVAIVLMAVCLMMSCEPNPRSIRYNEDICARCKMSIADGRYGAEIVTQQHKVHTFDSIECMAAYRLQAAEDPHSFWVTDWNRPGELIVAEEAVFVQCPQIRSPMGLNLLAVQTEADGRKIQSQYGGEIMDWSTVKSLTERDWN